MGEVWFIENGRKRRGEKANCKQCGQEFVRRASLHSGKRKQFCSPRCYGLSQRRRVKVKCQHCGKEIEKAPCRLTYSRHGVFFCSRECKDKAQSLAGGCKEIQPSHYGTGRACYRSLCKYRIIDGCEDCGEKRAYTLAVHHKDGDRTNNDDCNLEVLCWNCHAKRHLRRNGDGWTYDMNSLTPRELLSEID